MEKIKVLLADDHPVVRECLRTMLETVSDIEVVAEACDGLEAIDKVNECHPDVVLMDLRMPNMDGLESTKRIRSQLPSTAVIMLTIYADDAYIVDAVRAGAVGYCSKIPQETSLSMPYAQSPAAACSSRPVFCARLC